MTRTSSWSSSLRAAAPLPWTRVDLVSKPNSRKRITRKKGKKTSLSLPPGFLPFLFRSLLSDRFFQCLLQKRKLSLVTSGTTQRFAQLNSRQHSVLSRMFAGCVSHTDSKVLSRRLGGRLSLRPGPRSSSRARLSTRLLRLGRAHGEPLPKVTRRYTKWKWVTCELL